MAHRGYIGVVSLAATAATAIVVMAILASTPVSIGPLGVTLWFLALGFGLSSWLALAFYLLGRKLQPAATEARQRAASSRRGILAGGYITVILALSSLQQLGPRDILILGLLVILVEFYLAARS